VKAQHLSDEAVAACADGVLGGHARERATRHLNDCAECAQAVRVQREAVFALRAAPAPALPLGLASRLRSVPQTTPIEQLPTVVAEDGTTMLATFAHIAPVAAFVADAPTDGRSVFSLHRAKPFVASAAVVALAGSLIAGSVARDQGEEQLGHGNVVNDVRPAADVTRDGLLMAPTMVSAVRRFGGPRH
jgi:hypothetical protein